MPLSMRNYVHRLYNLARFMHCLYYGLLWIVQPFYNVHRIGIVSMSIAVALTTFKRANQSKLVRSSFV
ncbi:hypothetical protein L596_019666 [Steinernema carpocapsae]|uniref:Uncharacterized protein n=1 Tax=Steinernema carpocapsae TaxID=34508 RepID=A0A4U5MR75_STECR|nr:hypothetical protein L596_019666 [Steinernema carpocapsae]